MKKQVIILDIKQKVDELKLIKKLEEYNYHNNLFIALTPYSSYFYDNLTISYSTFHSYISTIDFRESVNDIIFSLENELPDYYNSLMIDLIKLVSFEQYEKMIINIINKYNNNEIIYITDTNDKLFDKTNQTSVITSLNVKKIYIKSKTKQNSCSILRRVTINKLKHTLIKYLFNLNLNYDWNFFIYDIQRIKTKTKTKTNYSYTILKESDLTNILYKYFKYNYSLQKIKSLINIVYDDQHSIEMYLFLTWESNLKKLLLSYKNFTLFYQHGNYFYVNMIFQYSEVKPAKINFVFNDYTKKLFEDLGSKKVYSVGSILFNQKIKERKKEYDFLYITQGHDYTGNRQYVDFPNSLHSFDGYELYQRHKSIIKLFGEKLKEKKIIIRVHPLVITNGVYVPFWELAEPYPNITIDVSIPIHTLIEKSKYIVSDYFTTEFINREIHYKRDIILFQGAPTPLPEETVEDMKKMFILVDTVDDLEYKVKNIDKITKNRKRYDDIIEYYSSKKCYTKKVVKEILKKELEN